MTPADPCACGHAQHEHLLHEGTCTIAPCKCRYFIAPDEHDGDDEGAAQAAMLTAELAAARADLARVEGERDALAAKVARVERERDEANYWRERHGQDAIASDARSATNWDAANTARKRARAWKALARTIRRDLGTLKAINLAALRVMMMERTTAQRCFETGWAAIVERDAVVAFYGGDADVDFDAVLKHLRGEGPDPCHRECATEREALAALARALVEALDWAGWPAHNRVVDAKRALLAALDGANPFAAADASSDAAEKRMAEALAEDDDAWKFADDDSSNSGKKEGGRR